MFANDGCVEMRGRRSRGVCWRSVDGAGSIFEGVVEGGCMVWRESSDGRVLESILITLRRD